MAKAYESRCRCGAKVEGVIGGAWVSKAGESKHVGAPPAKCPFCGDTLPTRTIESKEIRRL